MIKVCRQWMLSLLRVYENSSREQVGNIDRMAAPDMWFYVIILDVTRVALGDPVWLLTLGSDEPQRTAAARWFPSCHSTVKQQVGQQAAAAAMTVTYSRRVADAGLGTFFNLLLRWKGSIYKLLYRELVIFTLLYYFFSIVYRYSVWRKNSCQFHGSVRRESESDPYRISEGIRLL